MHKSLTADRLLEAVNRRERSLDDPGFCKSCGNEQGGCEPDAEDYECEACGDSSVSAPEILLGIV